MKKSYFYLIIIILASCSNSSYYTEGIHWKKRSPLENHLFIASIKNDSSASDYPSSTQAKEKTEYTSGGNVFYDFEKPRQNIFARKMSQPIEAVSSSSSDNLLLVKDNQNTSFANSDTKNAENDLPLYQGSYFDTPINQNVRNEKLDNNSRKKASNSKTILLGIFSSIEEAKKAAISASKYTGVEFMAESKGNAKYEVKSENNSHEAAYRVANLALKLGYYDAQVVAN